MKTPNRLINEKSPYLLQHAYNPVDWFPWCKEAFDKAKAEDKPIFLSIGYSTCHWCHVMERESFEDPETAEIMNRLFVNIKVDREELPDVDSIYMASLQMMGARGGWPLNVFLTPDLKPFFGGTYFPPVEMHGLASFRTVLERVGEAWHSKRREILIGAEQIANAIATSTKSSSSKNDVLSEDLYQSIVASLHTRFDQDYGGFDSAPKFPQAAVLNFLLDFYSLAGSKESLEMAIKTLRAMRSGGIFDHIGGGFHRYAVDSQWLIPHFEKMLYDNALLASTYIDAWRITKDDDLLKTARETLDYILRDMTSPEGGFYTAEDADSEGEEGKFYIWNQEQIAEILGDNAPAFCGRYGVTKQGNFEHGNSVLHYAVPIEEISQALRIPVQELQERFEQDKKVLLAARSSRVRPSLDDKILTGWNGLMISAMAAGFQATDDICYLNAAIVAADFILNKLLDGDVLLRRYREGDSSIPGNLEDYAFFIQGLLDLYQSTFNRKWAEKAQFLANAMINRFYDEENGGFYDSPEDSPNLLYRTKEGYDSAIPSANSAAVRVLEKLARLFRNDQYQIKAKSVFAAFGPQILRIPAGFLGLVRASFPFIYPPSDVVLTGDPGSVEAKEMLKAVWLNHTPNIAVAFACENALPIAEGYVSNNSSVSAFVCTHGTCRPPVSTPAELTGLLRL